MTSRSIPWPVFTLLTATSVAFGLQLLRAAQPQIAFLLRDRFDWPSPMIGVAALLLFATSFWVVLVARQRDVVPMLVVLAGGLVLARLAVQQWTGDPVGDLVLSVAGVVAFVVLLGLLMAIARVGRSDGMLSLVCGLLYGVAVDLLFLGMQGPILDLAWRDGGLASGPVLALGLVHLAGLAFFWRPIEISIGDLPIGAARAWIAIGPWLGLHVVLFGNPARLAATLDRVGSPWLPLASAPLLVVLLLGVWLRLDRRAGRWLVGTLGVALIVWTADPWRDGPGALVATIGAAVVAHLLMAVLVVGIGTIRGDGEPGFRRGGLAHGTGMVVFALLLFVQGAALDVDLPIGAEMLLPLAAAWLAGAAWVASGGSTSVRARVSKEAVMIAMLVLSIVIGTGAIQLAPRPDIEAPSWPVRILSYNVHCGVNPAGALDLDGIATTIERADADLVALQEVTRGWPSNGGADLPAWLADRLGLGFVFHGTADPTWGNAALGRWALTTVRRHPLPSADQLIARGALETVYAESTEHELRLITTHLHHRKDGGAERLEQVRALIDLWGGRERTVIAGDLNAEPDRPEMELLRNAGLIDAFAAWGDGDGFTFRSKAPYERIDYLWLSPDLV
ncbi:MAG: endonuclease/exonuclease/phosphatase family protein, partial [Acidobacteriota bacterium]